MSLTYKNMPHPRTKLSKIVIATGGTGGHVFPAEALASELIEQTHDVVFVGGGLESNRYFHKTRFKYREVAASSIVKINIFRSFWKIAQGILQSIKILTELKPQLVIGFGSFYTFPVLFAARLKKIPIVLFEPNAVPGKVNRLFSRWTVFSAVQFAEAGKELRGKVVEVKMPTPKETSIEPGVAREYFYLDPSTFTFLVFGGSQGSESINRLFLEAAKRVKETARFQVIHITGKSESVEKFRQLYASAGIPACVKSFEEKMRFAWSASSAVVCRSGAATAAELIRHAVPGICIPFPKAADDHQTKNAQFIEEKVKGAITCPESTLTVELLATLLTQMLRPSQRDAMHQAILAFQNDEKKKEFSSVIKDLV